MIRKTAKYGWQRFLADCGGGLIGALIALQYGLSMASVLLENFVRPGFSVQRRPSFPAATAGSDILRLQRIRPH
jgi:hypothetical protein